MIYNPNIVKSLQTAVFDIIISIKAAKKTDELWNRTCSILRFQHSDPALNGYRHISTAKIQELSTLLGDWRRMIAMMLESRMEKGSQEGGQRGRHVFGNVC